jgi:hypothetical protein
VSFPGLRYLHVRPCPFAQVREKLRKLVLDQGILYVDLYEPLRDSGAQVLTVSKWDDHPNEVVHAIAADQIYHLLVSSGLKQTIEEKNSGTRRQHAPCQSANS